MAKLMRSVVVGLEFEPRANFFGFNGAKHWQVAGAFNLTAHAAFRNVPAKGPIPDFREPQLDSSVVVDLGLLPLRVERISGEVSLFAWADGNYNVRLFLDARVGAVGLRSSKTVLIESGKVSGNYANDRHFDLRF